MSCAVFISKWQMLTLCFHATSETCAQVRSPRCKNQRSGYMPEHCAQNYWGLHDQCRGFAVNDLLLECSVRLSKVVYVCILWERFGLECSSHEARRISQIWVEFISFQQASIISSFNATVAERCTFAVSPHLAVSNSVTVLVCFQVEGNRLDPEIQSLYMSSGISCTTFYCTVSTYRICCIYKYIYILGCMCLCCSLLLVLLPAVMTLLQHNRPHLNMNTSKTTRVWNSRTALTLVVSNLHLKGVCYTTTCLLRIDKNLLCLQYTKNNVVSALE